MPLLPTVRRLFLAGTAVLLLLAGAYVQAADQPDVSVLLGGSSRRPVFARSGEKLVIGTGGPGGISAVSLYSRRLGLAFTVPFAHRGINLELSLTPELPPDFFDVQITFSIKGQTDVVTIPRAVRLLRGGDGSLRIVHLSDMHYDDRPDKRKELNQVVEAVNIIDPDLILFTGDLMTDPDEAGYCELSKLLSGLTAPIYFCPGNHDHQRKDLYHRYFSPDDHFSFEVGSFHFVSLDTGGPLTPMARRGTGMDEEQMEWLGRDLAAADDKEIIIFLHHSPVVESDSFLEGRRKFFRLLEEHPVRAVLAGHLHRDAAFDLSGREGEGGRISETGYVVIHTTTLASRRLKGESHGFRLLVLGWQGVVESSPPSSIPPGGLEISCSGKGADLPYLLVNNTTWTLPGLRVDLLIPAGEAHPLPGKRLWHGEYAGGNCSSRVLDIPPGKVSLGGKEPHE